MVNVRRLANAGLVVAALFVALGIAEVVVRGLYADKIVLYPRYHTNVDYGDFTLRRIRPNSEFWHKSVDGSWKFVTNSKGFRSYVDYKYQKPPGTIRLLSLGDSHTQGYEVRQDYTFSAVAERYLKKQNLQAEVLNTGISGFSTAEELIFLENEGIKYQPDVVLLGFFANDLEDNVKAGLFRIDKEGNLIVSKKHHIPGVRIQNLIYELPGIQVLSENSYFYSMLFNATWRYFKHKLTQERSKEVEEATEYAIPTQDGVSEYQVTLASAIIRRMYQFCTENDTELIIIDIPAFDGRNGVASSVPTSLKTTVRRYSDAYLSSESVLGDYSGVAEIHLPHGHRHISEFTHTLIGVAAAKKSKALLEIGGESSP